MLLEVLNRGGTQANFTFFATEKGPLHPEDLTATRLSDTFIFDQGFTVAWVGWQFDLPKGPLRLQVTVAAASSIVREGFIPEQKEAGSHTHTLSQPNSYCAADAVQPAATLTIKTRFDEPGKRLPRAGWSFAREDGQPDPCSLLLPEGFKQGLLYKLNYLGAQAARSRPRPRSAARLCLLPQVRRRQLSPA